MELYAKSEDMEMIWLFWLRFCQTHESAYDSNFLFSLGHNLSYESDSDFDSSENEP